MFSSARFQVVRGSVLLGLVLGLGLARGQPVTADDEYLRWFHALQSAERAAQAGEQIQANRGFREALNGLLAFERAHPAWHPDIVGFRLRYLRDRLGLLEQKPPKNQPPTEPNGVPLIRDVGTSRDRIETRLREIESERDELRARLREALAAQPDPGVSPALLRAQDRIRSQRKEIDLLRVTLAERHGNADNSRVWESERVEHQGLSEKLEAEQARVRYLEEERLRLIAVVQHLKRAASSPEAKPDIAVDSGGGARAGTVAEPASAADAADDELLVLGRAAEAAPNSTSALCRFGDVLVDRGLTEAAEAVFSRALDLDSTCANAHLAMSRLTLLRVPPAGALARWHYQQARTHGAGADPDLETRLSIPAQPVAP
jgi:tetratricopeptide (TPR) repeat protein